MCNLESKNYCGFNNQGLVLFIIRNKQTIKLFIASFPPYTTIKPTEWNIELNGRYSGEFRCAYFSYKIVFYCRLHKC